MGCFDNIIGVVGCDGSTSTSGLWLNGANGIAGVNINTASKSVDSETISGATLLKACVQNASTEIVQLFITELSKYWQFGTILQNYNYTLGSSLVSGEKSLNLAINTDCARYTSFYIDTLTFKSSEVKTDFSVTINDIEYIFDLEADVPYQLEVNKSYHEDLSISINDTNMYYGTSFFSGLIQYRCDEDLFSCQFKKELAPAIRYMSAHLYFKEITSSDRFNLATTMGLERAKENEDYNYKKSMQSLSDAINKVKNFLSTENCCCLKCTDIKYTYSTP